VAGGNVIVAVGVLLGALSVWVILIAALQDVVYGPSAVPRWFQRIFVGLGLIGVSGVTLYSWATTGHSEDRAMWPLPAIGFSFVWLMMLFAVAVVVALVTLGVKRLRR
jgi:hypothetical protein